MDNPTASGENQTTQANELARLRSLWEGMYSIDARSLPELRSRIREDHGRRVAIRPGSPERMST
jgi:hypothetical protein